MTRRRAASDSTPRYPPLALACAMALAAAGWNSPAHAAAAAAIAASGFAEFDRGMLAGGNGNAADLSRFEHDTTVLPGTYNLDIHVNQAWVARMDVRFAAPSADANAVPCVTADLLRRMGLVPTKPDAAAAARLASGACVQLSELIPGAKFVYDQSSLSLDASIPQAYTGQAPRGYVDPASWDQGIPALLLNYNVNTYHASNAGQSQTSTYLGLNAGLNIGPWHIRQDSTATWQSGSGGLRGQRHWQNINAYVRRDLPRLRSTLTVGDSYTDGAVFDSVGVRGVQLGTDDRMLPQSLQGYAPVIHGVADSNAKVTVSQNGVQIYQTTVAPGPFVINDLYPAGYGGDLVVTVTEADGRSHGFTTPYASVAQLLRPGITRFDIVAGQLRNNLGFDGSHPGIIQGTMQHGFNNLVTGYAGFQGSEGYGAGLLGAAFNTRAGALAMDITQAHAGIPGFGTHNGQSLRVTYSKIIPETKTSITVAAYRYSTRGFLSLQNAEYARDYAGRGLDMLQYQPSAIPTVDGVPVSSLLTPAQRAALAGTVYNPDNLLTPTGLLQQRDRFTLTTNQQLGERYGSLYANVSVNSYWNQRGRDAQFQFGYGNHFRRLSWSITLSRGRTSLGGYDNQVFFSANLPLGSHAHAPSLSVNVNHGDTLGSQAQATLSGTAGEWNQFTYGATASHGSGANGGTGDAFSVNAGYSSPYAVLNASLGKGSGYSQESFGANGSWVAHKGGITFGQSLGETPAIVHVPGAAGAHVANAPGVRVDRCGYALVPFLAPYQLDTVQIDPRGLPLGVQLDATSANVAPYAGAIVMLEFKSHYGQALIARIRSTDSQFLPFGTEIQDAGGQPIGTVGQGGLALLRITSKSGEASAHWQDTAGAAQSCAFAYSAPESTKAAQTRPPIEVVCRVTDARP